MSTRHYCPRCNRSLPQAGSIRLHPTTEIMGVYQCLECLDEFEGFPVAFAFAVSADGGIVSLAMITAMHAGEVEDRDLLG